MKKIIFFLSLLASSVGFSQPTTSAPIPPARNSSDVVSIYGDSYTNISGINYNPGWGQSGSVNTAYNPGDGNLCMAYTNFNYQGTGFEATPQNLAAMEYLHVDVWSSANPATSILQVSPINSGTGTGAGEFLVTINHTAGSWYSVDIPKSAFTGMTWDAIFQMKFAANGPGSTVPMDVYLDNIYFWKNPTNPASDATLSDLQVDGTTVTGFNSAVIDYTIVLPNGTTTVPQITMATTTNASATKQINQASALPGSASVVVTSADTSVTKTYTINFVLSGPGIPAPTPPARPTADVVSIFSDAYSNVTVTEWGPNWGPSSSLITEVQIASNPTKVINVDAGKSFAGIVLANYYDLTSFTHFHIDYWIDNPILTGQDLSIKLSNHASQSGETNAVQTSSAPTGGSWVSLDVPLSSFTEAGAPGSGTAINSVKEIVVSAARADMNQSVKIYFDNLYFHKNTLGTSNFDSSSMILAPNPVRSGELVTIPFDVNSVEIYNLNGQLISKTNQNTITTSSLSAGMYIVKAIDTNGSSKVSKLMVK